VLRGANGLVDRVERAGGVGSVTGGGREKRIEDGGGRRVEGGRERRSEGGGRGVAGGERGVAGGERRSERGGGGRGVVAGGRERRVWGGGGRGIVAGYRERRGGDLFAVRDRGEDAEEDDEIVVPKRGAETAKVKTPAAAADDEEEDFCPNSVLREDNSKPIASKSAEISRRVWMNRVLLATYWVGRGAAVDAVSAASESATVTVLPFSSNSANVSLRRSICLASTSILFSTRSPESCAATALRSFAAASSSA